MQISKILSSIKSRKKLVNENQSRWDTENRISKPRM